MKMTASAVVIGGGIVGASIACYLAKLGLDDVVLLERGPIGGEATGKSGALVRTDYSNPWDTALALKSLEIFSHWRDLIGGDSPFNHTGFLRVVSPGDVETLRRQVEMLRSVGTGTRLIGAEQVRELPYVVVFVKLQEGPMMMANLVDWDRGEIQCEAPVEVTFVDATTEISLPQFRLIKESPAA